VGPVVQRSITCPAKPSGL